MRFWTARLRCFTPTVAVHFSLEHVGQFRQSTAMTTARERPPKGCYGTERHPSAARRREGTQMSSKKTSIVSTMQGVFSAYAVDSVGVAWPLVFATAAVFVAVGYGIDSAPIAARFVFGASTFVLASACSAENIGRRSAERRLRRALEREDQWKTAATAAADADAPVPRQPPPARQRPARWPAAARHARHCGPPWRGMPVPAPGRPPARSPSPAQASLAKSRPRACRSISTARTAR